MLFSAVSQKKSTVEVNMCERESAKKIYLYKRAKSALVLKLVANKRCLGLGEEVLDLFLWRREEKCERR